MEAENIMVDYNCIICNKVMISLYDNIAKYSCQTCGVILEPPISIYGKWTALIKSFERVGDQTYMNTTVIRRKSLEECKRVWKLRGMW